MSRPSCLLFCAGLPARRAPVVGRTPLELNAGGLPGRDRDDKSGARANLALDKHIYANSRWSQQRTRDAPACSRWLLFNGFKWSFAGWPAGETEATRRRAYLAALFLGRRSSLFALRSPFVEQPGLPGRAPFVSLCGKKWATSAHIWPRQIDTYRARIEPNGRFCAPAEC